MGDLREEGRREGGRKGLYIGSRGFEARETVGISKGHVYEYYVHSLLVGDPKERYCQVE